MIQVRLFEEKDLDQAQKILGQVVVEYTIDYKNMMVIEERGKIYGVSGYKLINSSFEQPEVIMDLLVIDADHRMKFYGDSLLKATLNLLDRRGIKGVYLKACDENRVFFEKVRLKIQDLTSLDQRILGGLDIEADDLVFKADLPEFFNTACRSKGN